jgi:hypothetical protein
MANELDDFTPSEVAILLTTCNKYIPGKQTFRLQSIVGLEENSDTQKTTNIGKANLLNKDASNIPISTANTSNVIDLDVPKEVTLNYPTKFIPPGTRFIVSFVSGDITKPIIVGREF